MTSAGPAPADENGAPSAVGLDERRLRLLLEIGQSVVAELDLEVVLAKVLGAARELTGARYAAVGVMAPDRRSLERFVTSGIDPEAHARIGDLPRGRGILGLLIDEPYPLRLADVGAHPRSYGFPLDHPPMATFLGVPVVIAGRAWGNLYLTEKDGGEFDEQDEAAIVILAAWAAKAVANARLYQAEQSRRDALERTVRALETTTEIARAIGGETQLDRVLELIVKRGRALVEAESMVLLLQDGDELVITAIAGAVHPDMLGQRVPIEGSETGSVLRSRRAERIADVKSRLRYGLGDRLDATTGLLVPLLFHGRALGVLGAFDRLTAGPGFSAEDERLMDAFATSAATAVATAQNVAQLALRRSIEAAETERGRWARELHDDTLQELAALKIALAGARRATDLDAVGAVLEDAVAQIDTTIRDLRAIINDLRPASLDALGIVPAVEALVERAKVRSSVDLSVSADLAFEAGRSPHRLAPPIELAVYRLVQEALTNAVRHAGASRVAIELTEEDGTVTVEVRDDGKGFDPNETHAGFGLIGMRERVAFAGGTIAVESSADGTRILLTLPAVRRPNAEQSDLADGMSPSPNVADSG
jgi:two-component system, NarL family, sensor histidine kinase DevS